MNIMMNMYRDSIKKILLQSKLTSLKENLRYLESKLDNGASYISDKIKKIKDEINMVKTKIMTNYK